MISPPGGGIFFLMFAIIFIVIIGTVIVRVISGISRWNSNNSQPVLTVPVSVVTKRTQVYSNSTNNHGQIINSGSTSYFVTFQFESGDRLELRVRSSAFGLIAEGDTGKLTFQGTRFLEFSRM